MTARWSRVEDDVLISRYRRGNTATLALELGRTQRAVAQRARTLGLQRPVAARVTWTPDRDDLIRAEYLRIPMDDLAARLGCTRVALVRRAAVIGVAWGGELRNRWKPEQDRVLRELYRVVPNAVLAAKWGTTERAVQKRAERLGLTGQPMIGYRYQRDKATIDRLRILLASALELVPADRVAAALGVPLEDLATVRAREAVRGVRLVQERERRATASEATP